MFDRLGRRSELSEGGAEEGANLRNKRRISDRGEGRSPVGIAVTATGTVYVMDSGNSRVQRFDSDGGFQLAWGSDGPGPAQFDSPEEVYLAQSGEYGESWLILD